MTDRRRRFHFIYAFKYIKFMLLACLVPMINALRKWDWDSLLTAIQQDIVLLVLLTLVVLCLWACTGYSLRGSTLLVRQGIIARREQTFRAQDITAIVTERPLHCRLLSASHVTLYFRSNLFPRKFTLYATKKDAAAVTDALMPDTAQQSLLRPSGADWVIFIMLSTNIVTSAVFAYLSVRSISRLLGENWQEFALERFTALENLLAQIVPAGAAILATLLFVIITVTVGHSFFSCAGYHVQRAGDVLLCRGGLVTKTERRIRISDITTYDVHMTPAARLLRRNPVYVRAGGYSGTQAPVLAYRPGQESMVEALLPHFAMPERQFCTPSHKSVGQYIYFPLSCLLLSAVFYGAAIPRMPALLPVLTVPILLSIYALLTSLRGWRNEGVGRNADGTLCLCTARSFTVHYISVLTDDVCLCLKASSIAAQAGRANAYTCTPCRTYRTRGVDLADINAIFEGAMQP